MGCNMEFEAFRCEDCVYGKYFDQDYCWGCIYGITDEKECEKLFEEDERT